MNTSADAFDPFAEGDDILVEETSSDVNTSMMSVSSSDFFNNLSSSGFGGGGASSVAGTTTSFDTSFDSIVFRFPATMISFPGDKIGTAAAAAATASSTSMVDVRGTDNDNDIFGVGDGGGGGTDSDLLFPPMDDSFHAVSSDTNAAAELPISEVPTQSKKVPVHVAVHEEMTFVHDSFSRTSSCSVEGTIHVRSCSALEGNPFCLTLRDPQGHLEYFSEDPGFVDDISLDVKQPFHLDTDSGDRAFRITIPEEDAANNASIPIATYICSSTLRPIPLLVQSKVRNAGKLVRVAVKIRTNPSNEGPLTNVAILMAVPPDINGETVKMSRRGGVWDCMKRVIVWSIEELKPGRILEVQAQFEFSSTVSADDTKDRIPPKFPVLVRGDVVNYQLSGIVLEADQSDDFSTDVEMKLSPSFRLLHRKV